MAVDAFSAAVAQQSSQNASISALPPSQTVTAADRAVQIQQALKSIVLQTAYALRSRTQLSKLGKSSTSPFAREISRTNAANESATSLEPLGAECSQYLSLVGGLRDYLLHAQAALELHLEATTRREAKEEEERKQAAADELGRQQASENARAEHAGKLSQDTAALTTNAGGSASANTDLRGAAAGEAIVIDSDDNEDHKDNISGTRPARGPDTSNAAEAVDLTESPAVQDATLPVSSNTSANAASSAPGLTNNGLGLDVNLSSLGMNLDSLSNLSSFDMAGSSLPDLAASTAEPNYNDLGSMMGIDLSAFGGTNSGGTDLSGLDLNDFSSFANLQSGSTGDNVSGQQVGLGDSEMDLFGGSGDNGGGLDLSSFDFSSLGGDGDTGGDGSNGGVDLSAFLTTFGTK